MERVVINSFLGIEEHWTRVCEGIGQKHRVAHYRSTKALQEFSNSKYMPHQGKRECAKRRAKS